MYASEYEDVLLREQPVGTGEHRALRLVSDLRGAELLVGESEILSSSPAAVPPDQSDIPVCADLVRVERDLPHPARQPREDLPLDDHPLDSGGLHAAHVQQAARNCR